MGVTPSTLMTAAQTLTALSAAYTQFRELRNQAAKLTIDDPALDEQRQDLMELISRGLSQEITEAQGWLVAKRQRAAVANAEQDLTPRKTVVQEMDEEALSVVNARLGMVT